MVHRSTVVRFESTKLRSVPSAAVAEAAAVASAVAAATAVVVATAVVEAVAAAEVVGATDASVGSLAPKHVFPPVAGGHGSAEVRPWL